MKLTKKIIITMLAVIVVLYSSLQVKFHYKINTDYKIIQAQNINDNKIKNLINEKYPIVINKFLNEHNLLFNITNDILINLCKNIMVKFNIQDDNKQNKQTYTENIQYINKIKSTKKLWSCSLNKDCIKQYNLFNKIIELLKPIQPKLMGGIDFNLSMSSKGYIEHLNFQESYKTVIVQLSGSKLLRLFNPKFNKDLYLDNKYHPNFINTSKINIWENHEDLYSKFPKLKNAEYIDIILRTGNCIAIPNFWSFSTINLEDSVSIQSNFETIFSSLINLPNKLIRYTHNMGLYKADQCYCHVSKT